MSAIVKAEPSVLDTLITEDFPRTVIDVILRQACPRDMPQDEQYVFLMKCRQTALNPLAGEALCVPRNDKNKGRVYTFQPTAEGMRARAARFPDFVKVDSAPVYENDLCVIDHDKGTVGHQYNLAKKRGSLVAAWGRVVKRDGSSVIVPLPVSSRSGNTDFWRMDQGGMLAKCAEVAALRKAYPVAFEGVYVPEELGTERPLVEAKAAPLPPPPEGPRCAFGKCEGRLIADMMIDEVREAVALAEENLAKPEAEKWPPKTRAKVEKGLAELRAALPPALPEPGLVTDFEVVTQPVPATVTQDNEEQPPEPTEEEWQADQAAKKGKRS